MDAEVRAKQEARAESQIELLEVPYINDKIKKSYQFLTIARKNSTLVKKASFPSVLRVSSNA